MSLFQSAIAVAHALSVILEEGSTSLKSDLPPKPSQAVLQYFDRVIEEIEDPCLQRQRDSRYWPGRNYAIMVEALKLLLGNDLTEMVRVGAQTVAARELLLSLQNERILPRHHLKQIKHLQVLLVQIAALDQTLRHAPSWLQEQQLQIQSQDEVPIIDVPMTSAHRRILERHPQRRRTAR